MFFTKMHGLGNDFIVIENSTGLNIDYGKIAVQMCNRHFGIGGDGILVVENSSIAHSKMLIFNSDGSQAEMCGNGIRCFAKYLFDKGLACTDKMLIETLDGVKEVGLETDKSSVRNVKVNMGSPNLAPESIPADFNCDTIISMPINMDEERYFITSMLMGVPHTVLIMDIVKDEDIVSIGSKIENSRFFPKKTNVNFVKVINESEFYVRTWERGAGLTLACGTGTCAALVACVLNKRTARKAVAHLTGGDLLVEWSGDGNVYMTGPAETVFTGEYKSIEAS